jgi:hypothetical protein
MRWETNHAEKRNEGTNLLKLHTRAYIWSVHVKRRRHAQLYVKESIFKLASKLIPYVLLPVRTYLNKACARVLLFP